MEKQRLFPDPGDPERSAIGAGEPIGLLVPLRPRPFVKATHGNEAAALGKDARPHRTSEFILAGIVDRAKSGPLESPAHRHEVKARSDDGCGIGAANEPDGGAIKKRRDDPPEVAFRQSFYGVSDLVGVAHGRLGDNAVHFSPKSHLPELIRIQIGVV